MASTAEGSGFSSIAGNNGAYILIAVVVILFLVGLGYYILYKRSMTMPNITPFEDMKAPPPPAINTEEYKKRKEAFQAKEGFYGGVARGAGIPDCYRTSSEAAELHALFQGRVNGVEEGKEDFSELNILLSQLACFKKDLLGVAQQVEATRYQPFATQLDLEPIAETTARCFAKTIPERDLNIALDKWYKRGHFLITRLCTSANLSEQEVVGAEKTFDAFMKDIAAISKDRCLTGTPTMDAKPLPREPHPSGDPYPAQFGEYKGYY